MKQPSAVEPSSETPLEVLPSPPTRPAYVYCRRHGATALEVPLDVRVGACAAAEDGGCSSTALPLHPRKP